jgi:threonine aldolase
MVERLAEDHEKARLLAECFLRSGLFEIRPRPVKINLFFVRFSPDRHKGKEMRLAEELAGGGVLTYPPEDGWLRFVTHHDVSFEEIQIACRRVEQAATHFGV